MPSAVPSLAKGQSLHVAFLAVALVLVTRYVEVPPTEWLGISVCAWFGLALAMPVLHQVYVWLCWRLELRDRFITTRWGMERGFGRYVVFFFLLFGGRFLTLLLLAIADHDSVDMSLELRAAVAAPILLLAGYTMFSVKHYFGFRRAAGIDHFDPAYRSKPLVREGMFKWTPNAMYVFALQGTWLFGVLAASKLAMIAAGFQSVYIWVHYFGTEKPDMAHLYGD